MKKSIIFLLLVSLVLSSCTSFWGGSTTTQGKGLSARILTSPEINGKTLTETDSFNVNIEVINFFTSRKGVNGYLCLNDQSGSTYGGIGDNDCVTLSLSPAEDINGKINPTGISINFPNAGEYSYTNLGPTSIPNQIVADILYETETIAGGVACVSTKNSNKCQGSQSISLNKQDAPVMVSQIIASPSYRANEVILNLEIHISQVDDGEVLTPGNLLSAKGFSPELRVSVDVENKESKCTGSGFDGSSLEFTKLTSSSKIEKIIKCKSTINIPSDYINVPVNVRLGYGFKKRIEGPTFKLKKSEELI